MYTDIQYLVRSLWPLAEEVSVQALTIWLNCSVNPFLLYKSWEFRFLTMGILLHANLLVVLSLHSMRWNEQEFNIMQVTRGTKLICICFPPLTNKRCWNQCICINWEIFFRHGRSWILYGDLPDHCNFDFM
jgi:hypothetical protein